MVKVVSFEWYWITAIYTCIGLFLLSYNLARKFDAKKGSIYACLIIFAIRGLVFVMERIMT